MDRPAKSLISYWASWKGSPAPLGRDHGLLRTSVCPSDDWNRTRRVWPTTSGWLSESVMVTVAPRKPSGSPSAPPDASAAGRLESVSVDSSRAVSVGTSWWPRPFWKVTVYTVLPPFVVLTTATLGWPFAL